MSEIPLDLVVFRVADELYALELDFLLEVVRPETRALGVEADPAVGTATSSTGRIPAVDMRERLGLPRAAEPPARMLVARLGGGLHAGLLVDDVAGVRSFPSGALLDVPPLFTDPRERRIRALIRLEDERLVMLIDAERVLSAEERARLAAALEAGTFHATHESER